MSGDVPYAMLVAITSLVQPLTFTTLFPIFTLPFQDCVNTNYLKTLFKILRSVRWVRNSTKPRKMKTSQDKTSNRCGTHSQPYQLVLTDDKLMALDDGDDNFMKVSVLPPLLILDKFPMNCTVHRFSHRFIHTVRRMLPTAHINGFLYKHAQLWFLLIN